MSASRAIRWAKWGLAAGALLVVAAAAVRLYLLDGWLRTVRIEGASMAPTLSGAHLTVTCSDCGISFRCDAEHLPTDGELVCPNCGLRGIDAGAFPVSAGDTVLVDRWPLVGRGPQRWDIVAYSDPIAGGMAVKRVNGLPGEQLAIRGGDLYANGQIVRKSLAELRQVAILVHDNDHLPRSEAEGDNREFLRWRPLSSDSAWEPIPGGFRHRTANNSRQCDWLQYVHFRCDASGMPRKQPSPVLDNDAYNQSQTRRLNEISDLLLSCDVKFPPRGQLILSTRAAGGRVQLTIEVSTGAITVSQEGREIASAASPCKLAGRSVPIDFGQCDAQLLLGIAGEQVLAFHLDQSAADLSVKGAEAPPLEIAFAGDPVDITHLKVWRDLYLLEPNGTDRDWEMKGPLTDDEFLLLGDNLPVSIDGRHWKASGLSRNQLRGVVLSPAARKDR